MIISGLNNIKRWFGSIKIERKTHLSGKTKIDFRRRKSYKQHLIGKKLNLVLDYIHIFYYTLSLNRKSITEFNLHTKFLIPELLTYPNIASSPKSKSDQPTSITVYGTYTP